MISINRTAITIIPRQLYIDWANRFEDGNRYDQKHATTILILDKYGEFDYEVYLKKIFRDVFEEQLESWMTDPGDWPPKRTYKMFKEWFEVICSDMTWDYGDGDIEHDEY
ncbi:MAG: hypothetical protein HUK40_02735 [Desulfobacter sp.]|nr:hypothetical protein [Desulfobacter sp.]WDP85286.1 MAG: hypothetical protein HUN05_09175 [Desulfobacter sp.]